MVPTLLGHDRTSHLRMENTLSGGREEKGMAWCFSKPPWHFFFRMLHHFFKEQNTHIYECTFTNMVSFFWFSIFSPSLLNTTWPGLYHFLNHLFLSKTTPTPTPSQAPLGKGVYFRLGVFFIGEKVSSLPSIGGFGEAMVRSWSGNQIEAWRSDGRSSAIDWWMILRFV